MAAHDAGEGVAIGDGDGGEPEFLRPRRKFPGVRCAGEEGEITRDAKLSVAHGNRPATNQASPA